MIQPTGHKTQGESSRVCPLKKAIYGLKQPPRAWFDKFRIVITQCGLKRCVSNRSLFVRHSSAGSIVVAVYVEDIVISGDASHGITALKEYLSTHFHMKDFGHLCYFLRTEVVCSLRASLCLN